MAIHSTDNYPHSLAIFRKKLLVAVTVSPSLWRRGGGVLPLAVVLLAMVPLAVVPLAVVPLAVAVGVVTVR